jgi:hypothetical protein
MTAQAKKIAVVISIRKFGCTVYQSVGVRFSVLTLISLLSTLRAAQHPFCYKMGVASLPVDTESSADVEPRLTDARRMGSVHLIWLYDAVLCFTHT